MLATLYLLNGTIISPLRILGPSTSMTSLLLVVLYASYTHLIADALSNNTLYGKCGIKYI